MGGSERQNQPSAPSHPGGSETHYCVLSLPPLPLLSFSSAVHNLCIFTAVMDGVHLHDPFLSSLTFVYYYYYYYYCGCFLGSAARSSAHPIPFGMSLLLHASCMPLHPRKLLESKPPYTHHHPFSFSSPPSHPFPSFWVAADTRGSS